MIKTEKGETYIKGTDYEIFADLAIIAYKLCGVIPTDEVLSAVKEGIKAYDEEEIKNERIETLSMRNLRNKF